MPGPRARLVGACVVLAAVVAASGEGVPGREARAAHSWKGYHWARQATPLTLCRAPPSPTGLEHRSTTCHPNPLPRSAAGFHELRGPSSGPAL